MVYTVPETKEQRLKAAATEVRRIVPQRVETEETPLPGSLPLAPTGTSDDEEELAEAAAFATHVLATTSPTPTEEPTEGPVPEDSSQPLVQPTPVPPAVIAVAEATAPPTARVATGIRLGDLVQAGLSLGDRTVDPTITKRLAEAVRLKHLNFFTFVNSLKNVTA